MEVSDLAVQVYQETALRLELEGRLAQGQSLAEILKPQLDAQKEMTAQWRELYPSMAVPPSPGHSSHKANPLRCKVVPFGFFSIGNVPFPP